MARVGSEQEETWDGGSSGFDVAPTKHSHGMFRTWEVPAEFLRCSGVATTLRWWDGAPVVARVVLLCTAVGVPVGGAFDWDGRL